MFQSFFTECGWNEQESFLDNKISESRYQQGDATWLQKKLEKLVENRVKSGLPLDYEFMINGIRPIFALQA